MIKEPFRENDQAIMFIESWEEQTNHQVVAGMTTRIGGESDAPYHSLNLGLHVGDVKDHVLSNRNHLANQVQVPTTNWVLADQVHSNHIKKVSGCDKGKGVQSLKDALPATDGLYTGEKDLFLALCFADCVPLYFYAPQHELIGIAHAGWKGTVLNIGPEMVERWEKEEGVPRSSIKVAIGPSIGSCCYIVDQPVILQVDQCLEGVTYQYVSPYEKINEKEFRLNLKQLNMILLKNAGILTENIEVSMYCTSCNQKFFFSHRRDAGRTGRMVSFIYQ